MDTKTEQRAKNQPTPKAPAATDLAKSAHAK